MRRLLIVFVSVALALSLAWAVSADCGGKCISLQTFSRPLQQPAFTPTPGDGGHAPFEEPPFYLPYTPTPIH